MCPFVSAQSALREYLQCFKEGEDPVEYIYRLFKTVDIVIMGERDHRDITQYKLINDIISDSRFATCIGYVYTEVGVTNMTQRANALIKGSYESYEDYNKAKMNFLRDEDYLFCWEKTNRSIFIDNIYYVNNKLPDESKITLGLTDVEFDWYKIKSPAKYKKWYSKYAYDIRDKIMAKNFIKQYKRQKPINGHRKALLITNHPHAINNKHAKNEGFRIKQEFGNEKVKIICLNWYSKAYDGNTQLFDKGRWDAAFEQTECKPVAFSIYGTPLGHTTYKFEDTDHGLTFQNYMDGIIYYEPFYKFKASIGVEGFVDDSCKDEQIRRMNLLYDAGVSSENDYDVLKRYYNTERTFPCEDKNVLDQMKKQMRIHIEE